MLVVHQLEDKEDRPALSALRTALFEKENPNARCDNCGQVSYGHFIFNQLISS